MPRRAIAVAALVIVAGFVVLGLTTDFLVDWTWFSAIGYPVVFWTILGSKAALFVAVFAVSAILLWVNGFLASRFARRRGYVYPVDFEREAGAPPTLPELLELMSRLPWRLIIPGSPASTRRLGCPQRRSAMGSSCASYQVPYGESDPLYGKDIGFSISSPSRVCRPQNWLLLTLVERLVTGAVYWVHGDIDSTNSAGRCLPRSSPMAPPAGALLCGESLVLWSDRFLLLTATMGWWSEELHRSTLPARPLLLVGLAAIAAVAACANMWLRTYKLPTAGRCWSLAAPWCWLRCFPRCFSSCREARTNCSWRSPTSSGTSTQQAYNQISVKPFPVEQSLTFQTLRPTRRPLTISGCGTGSR
jgi:uncharacterized membrane protein (UPF0182 family)